MYILVFTALCFAPHSVLYATEHNITFTEPAEQSIIHQLLDKKLVHENTHPILFALMQKKGLPADVEIAVSQNIRYSRYPRIENEPIHGLLVLLTNTTEKSLEYTVSHTCPVEYRVYSTSWELLYDNVHTDACKKNEHLYIEHRRTIAGKDIHPYELTVHALPAGMYNIALGMNGKPAGIIPVTVVKQ